MLLGACGALAQPTARAADWQLQVHSDRHSDFSSIDDLRDGNEAGFRARGSRNLAYVLEEVRLKRAEGPWTLALVARSSATLVAGRQAIEAFGHRGGVGRDGSDRQWTVDARLRGFAGAGIEVERALPVATEWTGAVRVQALALTRWREQVVTGTGRFEAGSGTYTYDLRSREHNDRRGFPFQQEPDPVGAGLLFGGELAWKRGPWTARAAVDDIGWLHWGALPRQELALSTRTRELDAEGFVVLRPALQGQNSQSGHTRSAPYRISLDGSWQATGRGALTAGARYFRGFRALPHVGWKQRLGDGLLAATWQVHERRLVLDAQWGAWHAVLGMDRFSGTRSRVFGVRYSRSW